MHYEHIDGVEAPAQCSSEGESRYRAFSQLILHGGSVDGVVLCVRANKLDVKGLKAVGHRQTEFVALGIEHHPVRGHKAGADGAAA